MAYGKLTISHIEKGKESSGWWQRGIPRWHPFSNRNGKWRPPERRALGKRVFKEKFTYDSM